MRRTLLLVILANVAAAWAAYQTWNHQQSHLRPIVTVCTATPDPVQFRLN